MKGTSTKSATRGARPSAGAGTGQAGRFLRRLPPRRCRGRRPARTWTCAAAARRFRGESFSASSVSARLGGAASATSGGLTARRSGRVGRSSGGGVIGPSRPCHEGGVTARLSSPRAEVYSWQRMKANSSGPHVFTEALGQQSDAGSPAGCSDFPGACRAAPISAAARDRRPDAARHGHQVRPRSRRLPLGDSRAARCHGAAGDRLQHHAPQPAAWDQFLAVLRQWDPPPPALYVDREAGRRGDQCQPRIARLSCRDPSRRDLRAVRPHFLDGQLCRDHDLLRHRALHQRRYKS